MKIVIDSTLDVSDDLRKFVTVVPLNVEIASHRFKDEKPLEEVFEIMRKSKSFAKTSQPSPKDFERAYSELLKEEDWILSIHISSKLSGTYNSARIASEKFKRKVFVFDSMSASIAGHILVKEALKLSNENPEKVLRELKIARDSTKFYLTVDNLEFLKRSGRLKGVESIVSSILKLRPLIEVVEGALKTKKVHRGNAKVLKDMKKLMENAKEVIIGHVLNPQVANELKEHADSLGILSEIIAVRSCALSVHLGPKAYGIALRM